MGVEASMANSEKGAKMKSIFSQFPRYTCTKLELQKVLVKSEQTKQGK